VRTRRCLVHCSPDEDRGCVLTMPLSKIKLATRTLSLEPEYGKQWVPVRSAGNDDCGPVGSFEQ